MTTLSSWSWRLAPYLAGALLTYGLWTQHQALQAQRQAIQTYETQLRAQNQAMQDIAARVDGYGVQLRELAAVQSGFRADLQAREREIGDLKRENPDFRTWADSDLPPDARQLRERPTITGATGFREFLRTRGAVRPDGLERHDQRRPAAAD